MENQWAAKTTLDNSRNVIKIFAKKVPLNPTIEILEAILFDGFGIWQESSLNQLVKENKLSISWPETGNGFATFKKMEF